MANQTGSSCSTLDDGLASHWTVLGTWHFERTKLFRRVVAPIVVFPTVFPRVEWQCSEV